MCFFLSLSVCLIVCVSLPGFVCFSPFRPFSSGEQEKILFEWNYVTRDPRWHDLLSEFPAGFYFQWGRTLRRDVSYLFLKGETNKPISWRNISAFPRLPCILKFSKIISSLSFPGTEGASYLPMERCVPLKYFWNPVLQLYCAWKCLIC